MTVEKVNVAEWKKTSKKYYHKSIGINNTFHNIPGTTAHTPIHNLHISFSFANSENC